MTQPPNPAAAASRFRPRRSVLYVPASNARALAKAPTLGADGIVFDLEDAVAPAARAPARQALVAALAATAGGPAERIVRINAIGSADFEADLDAAAAGRPDAILLPKVETAADLEALAGGCRSRGLADDVSLWAMIETAGALLALESLAGVGRSLTPALDCLVVGTNDLAKDTGVDPGDDRRYLLPWLMQVILVGRRYRLTVLDGVWNDFADRAGFEAEAGQAVKMAFDGKTLIHPGQVEAANRLFSPSAEALAQARRIVAAFGDDANSGAHVINLDGRMVERLHCEQAEQLLARQAAIEALSSSPGRHRPPGSGL